MYFLTDNPSHEAAHLEIQKRGPFSSTVPTPKVGRQHHAPRTTAAPTPFVHGISKGRCFVLFLHPQFIIISQIRGYRKDAHQAPSFVSSFFYFSILSDPQPQNATLQKRMTKRGFTSNRGTHKTWHTQPDEEALHHKIYTKKTPDSSSWQMSCYIRFRRALRVSDSVDVIIHKR